MAIHFVDSALVYCGFLYVCKILIESNAFS